MKNMIFSSRTSTMAFAVLLVYILIAVGTTTGFLATDFDVVQNDLSYQPPHRHFLLGTDLFGRSVLERAMQATRIAITVGSLSTGLAVLIGVILGALAGYKGGRTDALIVWFYTTLDSIPYILLLSAFAFALGQGLSNLFLALGLTTWTTLCKIVRSEVMKLEKMDFVLAAKAQGLPVWKIIFQEILPNLSHLILIQAGVIFVSVIKIEVILSYLGLGLEPGSPSWGLMIDDAKQEITRGIWWNMFAATLFMFGLIFSTQILLESLRRHFDRKT